MSIKFTEDNFEIKKGVGFIYAFYRYSHSSKKNLFERMVSICTCSDCVHVGIVPVSDIKGDKFVVEDSVYTAFMGYGFDIQRVSCILNDAYEYYFIPVSTDQFHIGFHFLESLSGKGYNYLGLPMTLLPHSWKIKGKKTMETHKDPKTVICSQIGLFLLQKLDVGQEHFFNAAYCTPGELVEFVRSVPSAIYCSSDQFVLK